MENTATKSKKGYPFGFYACSLGFTFERCAFYTVKWLLAIWLATETTSKMGGMGLTSVEAGSISAYFVAATYITPMIGGYLADYWVSPRLCVVLGMILMGAGYLVGWQATNLTLVWVMIILVAIGTGLFKGNLSGVNSLMFDDQNELNSAFSVQYSFVNIGSFIGTTFVVLLADSQGYQFLLLIAGILLLVDAVWFLANGKSLGDKGKQPFKKDQRSFVDKDKKASEESKPLTTGDKKRVFAIIIVTLLSAIFWIVWYMSYNVVYYYFGFGDSSEFLNWADWSLFGWKIPQTSYFDSLNALTCIVLGPVFAIVWAKMAARPKGDMSMFKKTAIGIFLVGLSYVAMVLANVIRGDGQCSWFWVILIALLMSVGEMIFSPLGNSFISMFAPAKLMGLLLGFWPIAVFIATLIYPNLFGALDAGARAGKFNLYYGIIAAVVIVCAVLLYAFSGKLDKLSEEK